MNKVAKKVVIKTSAPPVPKEYDDAKFIYPIAIFHIFFRFLVISLLFLVTSRVIVG